MSARSRSAFTMTDVQRAIKAVEKLGKSVAGVDYPPQGGFRVLIGKPIESVDAAGARNEWDEVLTPQ